MTDSDSGAEVDVDGGADAGDTDDPFCGEIETAVSLSDQIPTVGVVKWSTSMTAITDARIEFGRAGTVEYTAPVNLNAPEHRTLLLGMKPSSVYQFQVVVDSDGRVCKSRPAEVKTGPLAVGLPTSVVSDSQPEAVSGEFIVTSLATKRTVFILDKDGDIVWWYNFGNADYEGPELEGFSRVHMSFDGTEMWGGNINFGRGNGRLYRVSMDGTEEAEPEITYHHHDFAVLPDNRLALIEFDEDGQAAGEGTCDRIVERTPDGEIETVYPLREGLAYLTDATEWCHANAIHYSPAEDAYYVSVLMQSLIVKIDRSARRLEWIFDGDDPDGDFTGGDWVRQHGFHALENEILIFSNGDDADGMASSARVLAYALDETAGTATLEWAYDSGIVAAMLGDVQRLQNGNTLVTYSTASTLHELDSNGALVRDITFLFGAALGYTDARRSLYGPPDRY